MRGHRRTALVVVAVAALAVWGCSNPLNEADSVSQDFVQAPQGMDVCYECHGSDVFVEWVQSRHSNFDSYNYATRKYSRLDPLDANSFLNTVEGYPGAYWTTYHYYTGCFPCHSGADYGGDILDQNVDNALFPDPMVGWPRRFLIDCEGCHVSGAGHLGAAQPPVVPVPALEECGECHGLIEDDHGVNSYRVWLNAAGKNPGGRNAPALTTQAIGGLTLGVWQLPAVFAWLGTPYAGPYLFATDRTILDTHFQEIYLVEGDRTTLYTVPSAKFGYVDLTNTSPNSGMVRGDSEEACTASCHKPHLFDLTINDQWFEGAHHPNLQGPLGTEDGELTVGGPANWGAVDHGGYSASCVRCHTSMGFAEVAPGNGSAVKTKAGSSDGFITCNGCHDGENYPSDNDKAMRIGGTIALFNYSGSPLVYVDAGTSSGCVYCHQGREDGSHVTLDASKYKPGKMETSTYPSYMTSTKSNPVAFRNMHYLSAGAMIYGEKGFEYPGKTYAGRHTHSYIESSCAACHMANTDPISTEIGGHTFHMAHGSTQNTGFCASTCHPALTDYTALRAHAGDWDGDGNINDSADEEVETLKDDLLSAITAYDSPDDADTTPQVYHQESHPYFFLNERAGADTSISQAWDPTAAKAAFNWQFIAKEPGAFAHNPRYAVQLLRDSFENITGSPLPGTRP